MVKYYDISDWEEQQHFSTGGTRDKSVVENPVDGCQYFFKTSLMKNEKRYTYEFWSEIIASEIGASIGLDILHYDVAWNKDRLGCLSKSMIDATNVSLLEGYRWLAGFDSSYDVNDKDAYTFQIIEKLLTTHFREQEFIKDLIEIVVFDSLVGNEDRHQENWGIIQTNKEVERKTLFKRKTLSIEKSYKFAPIYDSGSSLGRELSEDKVEQMLKNHDQLEAYIRRGKSEIHWAGEHGKQKHLELVSKIAANNYKYLVVEIIEGIKSRYKQGVVIDIVNNVDNCLPAEHHALKIPQKRKEFLIKLVSLRFNKLFELQL